MRPFETRAEPATLHRQTTAEEVAGVLREMVMTGTLAPGAPLREAALAAEFEVSRRTIRDALGVLEYEGLVRHHRHRGARITEFSAADINDLYEVRRTMELAAAAHAGDATPEAMRALDEAFERLRDATRVGRPEEVVQRDLDFHRAIVGLLASARFDRFFAAISVEMRYALSILESSYQESTVRPEEALDEHRAIYRALQRGNAQAASELINEHVEQNKGLLLQVVVAAAEDTATP